MAKKILFPAKPIRYALEKWIDSRIKMSNLIMDDWTLHQDHTGMATLKCSILLDSDFERILCEQCTPHPEGKE